MLTKRVLKWLEEEAKADPEKYDTFFKEHGHCLKEGDRHGLVAPRGARASCCASSPRTPRRGRPPSLADYVSRMPEEQKEIYYLAAPDREAAEASPYYEVFREKKFEVLFLCDPQDEFVMEHLRNLRQKRLVAAEKADLKLDKEIARELSDEDARLLANFIKETLGERVNEVRGLEAPRRQSRRWSWTATRS